MKKRQQHVCSHRLLQYLLVCVSIIFFFHIVLFETEHSCQMEKELEHHCRGRNNSVELLEKLHHEGREERTRGKLGERNVEKERK